jgi:hypothetical protein
MSKPRGNTTLADMSKLPEERAKGRKPGVIATPPAQMDHATSPRAKRLSRDGERWLAAQERPYAAPAGTAGTGRGPSERERDDSRD